MAKINTTETAKIYTAKMSADLLHKSPQAMSSLIHRNRIKAIREGKTYSILGKDLLIYIDTRLKELQDEAKVLQDVKTLLT